MLKLIAFLLISYNLYALPERDTPKPVISQTGKIYLGGKHIMLMNSNADEVFVIYYFGVFNESSEEKKIRVRLWLPKNTSTFEPGSGFTKKEIKLADDGTLYLEKKFKPGMNLMGLNFKVPYHERKPIEFESPFALTELNLATPKDSQITLKAKGFTPGLSEMLSIGNYRGIIKRNVAKGERFLLTIEGLPRPLIQTWYIFAVVASLLLLCLAFFLYKTYNTRKQK